MLGEDNTIIMIEIFTALIFLVSVILIFITLRDNRNFHKQRLVGNLVSEEWKLKIKLNEYIEKIDRTRLKRKQDEIWNDYHNLLFSYYEYLAMIIIKKMVREKDVKSYFKPLLIDVYKAFYHESEIFDEEVGPFRKDYFYLMVLFKRWKMKEVYDFLFRRED